MDKSINEIVRDIKIAPEWLFTWFQSNSTKTVPDKFHLLLADTHCQAKEVCNEKIDVFLLKTVLHEN